MTTNAEQKYDPEVVELLKALGRAYLENSENLRAAEKFRRLVDNGVEDAEILTNYALALARSEAVSEDALAIYKKSVEANADNESLYLTLATLFLKKEIISDPALKVYRRSLKFSPPFEDQIRAALEKAFKASTGSIAVTELRQTLMDCEESPELLSVYLETAWRDARFDDALVVLKDLYRHSNENPTYLQAICETLLEKKARAEEDGSLFEIAADDVKLCLQFKNPDNPIHRIGDVETYLDFKNLFLNFKQTARTKLQANDEYEFFILEKSAAKQPAVAAGNHSAAAEIDSSFDFMRDFVQKLDGAKRVAAFAQEKSHLLNRINTLGIFEIANFDASTDTAKLPFVTFLKVMSSELERAGEILICSLENGVITLNCDPDKLLRFAVAILRRLEKYNHVVDPAEQIHLKISLHCSLVPFVNLEKGSLKEIRKALKVHGALVDLNGANSLPPELPLPILLTESVAGAVNGYRTHRLGEFRLRHFPHPQKIFTVGVPVEPFRYSGKDVHEASVRPGVSKPQKFGKYDVVKAIRENQLCATFQGYDPQLERMVVIKAYRAQGFASFKEFSQLRKQFFEEVRKLNRISHPNISVIYDAGEQGDILYLVREFIEGEILNNYLLRDGLPEINKTVEFYRQICKILAAHHEEQIWHKNLKPENIFITSSREIKLTDSGLLQVRHNEKLWSEDLSSQAYSAPEQIQGLTLTQACDIFQLGVMLYESLTGVHPFRGKNAREVRVKILADEAAPASQFRADIPKEIDTILTKALAKAPDQRYTYIHEFSADLKKLIPASKETTSKRLLEALK